MRKDKDIQAKEGERRVDHASQSTADRAAYSTRRAARLLSQSSVVQRKNVPYTHHTLDRNAAGSAVATSRGDPDQLYAPEQPTTSMNDQRAHHFEAANRGEDTFPRQTPVRACRICSCKCGRPLLLRQHPANSIKRACDYP